MHTSATAAPGWYPCPVTPGQLRFFDGASWTERTAPAPVAPTPAPVQAGFVQAGFVQAGFVQAGPVQGAPVEASSSGPVLTPGGGTPLWEPRELPMLDPYADQVAPGSSRYAVPAPHPLTPPRSVVAAAPANPYAGSAPAGPAAANPYAAGAPAGPASVNPYAAGGPGPSYASPQQPYAGQPYAGQPYAGQPAKEGSGPGDAMHWIVPIGRSGASIAAGYVGLVSLFVWVLGPVAIGLGIWGLRKARTGGHGSGRSVFGIVTGVLATIVGVVVLAGWLTGGSLL